MRRTLHDIMVEEGGRILLSGLYEKGIMPHSFLRREAEALCVCQDVQREWLRGEITSPLFTTVLWEVIRRLKASERDGMIREAEVLYKVLEETAHEADGTGTPCSVRTRKIPPHCSPPAAHESATGARVEKYKRRHWAAYDADGTLVCVCVYRKGAEEVVRRVAPPAGPSD